MISNGGICIELAIINLELECSWNQQWLKKGNLSQRGWGRQTADLTFCFPWATFAFLGRLRWGGYKKWSWISFFEQHLNNWTFWTVPKTMHPQVDQKWPLVCHLLALVIHSRYRSVEECDTSFTLFSGLFTLHRVGWKGVKGVYTAMVKDPFRKWDRVDTVCALLVDLGQ